MRATRGGLLLFGACAITLVLLLPLVHAPIGSCGDGTCNHYDGESCRTCPDDCGVCAFCNPPNCNDNNACTSDKCNTLTGQCSHTLISCSDGNPCTSDSCDPATGCVHTPVQDGTDCGVGKVCSGGVCIASCTASSCEDDNFCTENKCGADGRCTTVQLSGRACTTADGKPGTCQPGSCVAVGCTSDATCPEQECKTAQCKDSNCPSPFSNATRSWPARSSKSSYATRCFGRCAASG